jgi:protein-S-isoprenylcysteine O-methyltransferase Ste14
MTPFLAKLIWLIGMTIACVIRYPNWRRARRDREVRRSGSGRERLLLAAQVTGQLLMPALYAFTDQPAFATYTFHPILAWAGSAVLALGLYLFYRAHADLGRSWSATLVIRERHRLVTGGVYRAVRHPMYSAFLAWAVAQALLLPNWIAGPAGLVGFALLFFGRVGHEERMMLETFGDEYRDYMARTRRVIPGLY